MSDRIFSFHASMPEEVVESQAAVFSRFGVPLEQREFDIPTGNGKSDAYAEAIEEAIRSCGKGDFVAIFDVDCIPLDEDAVPWLMESASVATYTGCQKVFAGRLVGAIQQSNHVVGSTPYVSPACMAFPVEDYVETLGSPSFKPGRLHDIGEEVTREAEKRDYPVGYLWPCSVEDPKWRVAGRWFGLGTTYGERGEGKFYHSFQSRNDPGRFLKKCKETLDENP